MGLDLVTGPAVEPVTWNDVLLHSRLPSDREKSLVEGTYIPAARQYAEGYTRRALITQTWALRRRGFPSGDLFIPKPPLQSVSSVQYYDALNASQTLAADQYEVTTPAGDAPPAGEFCAAYGVTWPVVYDRKEAVSITFVAGYGDDGEDVPAAIRRAILTLVAEQLERREQVVLGTISTPATLAAERLLSRFRVF